MSTQEPSGERERQSRLYAMLCHLLALSLLIGIPFGNILGPLVIWLIKKDEFPFVDDQGKEALNFHISMMIYAIAAAITVIGLVLVPVVIVVAVVYTIIAAVQASNGVAYRYPLTIRFVQ